jgi:hypothetical protein
MTVTCVAIRAPGSKGAASAKKAVTPVRKCRIPGMRILVEMSSIESHESSPHGHTLRDSLPETMSRLEAHSQTPRCSLPDAVPKPEPKASLQITSVGSTGGALISDFVATVTAG